MISRPFTKTEWETVRAALPARLKSIMDEIEYVPEICWTCDFYDGYEGKPGKCLHHECDIPNDERGKVQECWVQRVVPF